MGFFADPRTAGGAMTDEDREHDEPDRHDEHDEPGDSAEGVVVPIEDEIDLHAYNPRDVKEVVEEYLYQCRRRGFPEVRVIQGRGTGTLREVVRATLRRNPHVLAFDDAPAASGGWGATIVTLRSGHPDAAPPLPARPAPAVAAAQGGSGSAGRSEARGSLTPADRRRTRLVLGLGLAGLAVATVLMLLGIEPFANTYYFFAWYATIAIADAWAHLRRPREPLLLARPGIFLPLLAWSAVFWLSFELWNLRLENWYYVNVLDQRWLRVAGTIAAFATVLPGLFLVTRLLGTFGVGEGVRTRPFRFQPVHLHLMLGLGAVSALLVLAWPQAFFPLVWGVAFFLLAPVNHRVSQRGLLREIEAGRWGLVIRLLLGGALCGFLWEFFNIRAGAKWIYTVPGLEDLKLFEMPLLGFIGFPPFALECYEMYRAVIAAGLAPDWESAPRAAAGGAAAAGNAAGTAPARPAPGAPSWVQPLLATLAWPVLAVFSFATIGLMERYTVDSTIPRPADLTLVAADPALAGRIAELGIRDVARLDKVLAGAGAAARLGIPPEKHDLLAAQVDLVLLRGIGTANAARLAAVGVNSVDELARTDAAGLAGWLAAADPTYEPRLARLRVWIRGAQRAVAAGRAE